MAVIDFHTHVLPGIDDGSHSVDMSREMLLRMAEQGVETVVATPHFYADRDRIDRFLNRREKSCARVACLLKPDMPRLCLGAEVAYFRGISTAERIGELCLQGTQVLLLEMPFSPWQEAQLREVEVLLTERGFQLVLVHLERYLSIRENKKYIERLMELPLQVQINSSSLLDRRRRRQVLHLFRRGHAQLLGSDCHNLTDRPPTLVDGRQILMKKLGQDTLNRIDAAGELLLEGASYVQSRRLFPAGR